MLESREYENKRMLGIMHEALEITIFWMVPSGEAYEYM